MSEHQVVYSIYGPHNRCLYIGRSVDAGRRLSEHHKGKDWWREASTIQLTHTTRAEVDELERLMIRYYQPKYNVTHNPGGDLPDDPMGGTLGFVRGGEYLVQLGTGSVVVGMAMNGWHTPDQRDVIIELDDGTRFARSNVIDFAELSSTFRTKNAQDSL